MRSSEGAEPRKFQQIEEKKRKDSRQTWVVGPEDGRALVEGAVCRRPEGRLFSWGALGDSGVVVTSVNTCVCLVTVFPHSGLVKGFASAGVKNRQCLVINQHLHAVQPACCLHQQRRKARQKSLWSALSSLDPPPPRNSGEARL